MLSLLKKQPHKQFNAVVVCLTCIFWFFFSNHAQSSPSVAPNLQSLKNLKVKRPKAETNLPLRSNGLPTGTLASGTSQVTVSLNTVVNATCKYSTGITRVNYGDMQTVFSTTGQTFHSSIISGLSDGEGYNYYVRCRDSSGNTNTIDFAISFNIAGRGNGDSRIDKILFIGNSYTGHSGGVHNHLHRLMAASGRSVDVAGEIHGGEAFSYKNENYPGFASRREVTARINSDNWDAVVLQSYYEPEDAFYEAGGMLIDRVRNNGSDPILFMIWGHELYPDQDILFRQRIEHLGSKTKTQVIPIGIGIRTAHNAGLNVYSDGAHLSLDGAYLAGAIFYSFLTGESPVGLDYNGYSWNDTLTKDEALRLQTLAWQIVSDYGVFFNGKGHPSSPLPSVPVAGIIPGLMLILRQR